MHTLRQLFILTATLCVTTLSAQVRINEVMAQNNSGLTDPDYGESADWIELFNAGSKEVDLSGYSITDNLDTPGKYVLPAGTTLPAGGYLLLWCDDRGEGLHTAFKLSADGEEVGLFNAEGELQDQVKFDVQYTDVSYGRTGETDFPWAFFATPTPGAANDTKAYRGMSNQPMILTRGGFFTSAVTVGITNDLGGRVYYTTDGSQPTTSSAIYTGPLTFDKTTILRARIIEDGKMPGPVLTESYFVNEAFVGHQLPVVSIATEDANFWDAEKGIYMQDFKPEWEVPVNIEMFLNNGSDRSAFNEAAGIKINGLYAWQLPQKMLGVYFKKKYGESKLAYQLFVDDERSSFDNFALRASGSDWSYTLMRDGLTQQAARKGEMNLDLMAFRPCVVYVNGEFLGIHNIREKVDKDYIKQHYGYGSGEFDMVEGGDTPEVGGLDAWEEYIDFAKNGNLKDDANFAKLAEQMDLENFTDYLIAETYSGNTSLSHNTMAWKTHEGGKWRWILMDTDRGFFNYDENLISYFIPRSAWPLKNMLNNEGFKKYFFKRMADQLFTTFNTNEIFRQIDEHKADIDPVISQHVDRWLGTTSSYGDALKSVQFWQNEVNKLKDFATGRMTVLMDDLRNYGLSAPAMLSISSWPDNACQFDFNGHAIKRSEWSGLYPTRSDVSLTAKPRAGYQFKGWQQVKMTDLISRGSQWKYMDNGTDLGTAWQAFDYADGAWKEGMTPIGYGHSIAKTTASYGSSSSNKYITTYFRKHFDMGMPTKELRAARLFLLREDGAIVYLNGKRIITSNMTLHPENLNYKTLSKASISGAAEKLYVIYDIAPSLLRQGENVLAVEVHQCDANSSDMLLDVQLQVETLEGDAPQLGTSPRMDFQLSGDMAVCAVYEPTGESIVPDSIHADMVLYKAKSPYLVTGDVVVDADARLTIEPGVELLFSPGASIYVHGAVTAEGTPSDSILFRLNPQYDADLSWGALCFIHTGDKVSSISYAELRDANQGPKEYNCVAAISGFGTTLRLDHLNITQVKANPIAVRYSDLRLTHSVLHADITGDLTNVKYGKGYISDCEYIGNDMPDTDAIDYDGVTGGVIRKITAHGFLGDNSDAIDLGEQAMDVQVDSILVYDVTDKGVSVGQRSTAHVTNSTFIHTNLGLGVKDSCTAVVENCTFYAVQNPISCYEKVQGRAGGNAFIEACVFANSSSQDIVCDEKSFVRIHRSLSDTESLSTYGTDNLLSDPAFRSPALFDLQSDYLDHEKLGSGYLPERPQPQPVISEICYAPIDSLGQSEYLALTNPSDISLDLSGYTFSKGITFTFPEGTVLEAGQQLYIAQQETAFLPDALIWTSGKLANEGERIQLDTPDGIVVDHVRYSSTTPWPLLTEKEGGNILVLTDPLKDNHLAANWSILSTTDMAQVGGAKSLAFDASTGTVTFHPARSSRAQATVLDTNGRLIQKFSATHGTQYTLPYAGLYIVHFEGQSYKLLRIR